MTSKQIHITGLEQVEMNINRLIRDNWTDAKKGLREEANIILNNAVRQTPREFGDLRRSGTVEETKDTKREYEATIGFNESYAAAVHENLNAHHDIGKAKYLEDPLMARVDDIPKNIARRIKRGTRL